jgi:hypothetical protein
MGGKQNPRDFSTRFPQEESNQIKSGLLTVLLAVFLLSSAAAEVRLDMKTGEGFISGDDFAALKTAADLRGVDLEDLEYFAVPLLDYQVSLIHSETAEIKLLLLSEFGTSDFVNATVLEDRVLLTGFAEILDQPGIYPGGPPGERSDAAGNYDPDGEFIFSKVTPLESGKIWLRVWDAEWPHPVLLSAEIIIPAPDLWTPDPAGKVPLKLRGAGLLEVDRGLLGIFEAAGSGNHLGRWTARGTVQFVAAAGVLRAESLEVIFAAAGGDELRAVLSEDIGGFLDPETGLCLAVCEFAGGTGRFHSAEGWAVLRIQLLEDGAFVTSLEGMISRPRSPK